ncbi:response regulator [Nitrospira sp. KM1]|uniref:response regulator n=1 Tax=Nitrospira sp. KM1 TaxID=1936990 RepID=UPI001564A455|nr:response regulator [Nitrospira sp. KM1]
MGSALDIPSDAKPTVLIVDDEAAPRAALTQILRQDFNILTAENATKALAVLHDHGVDLVTLDLRLPDRNGADLLDEIKRTHATIEVIMVTAYGTLTSAMDCIRHGAAGFLLKPFNASELLTISLQTSRKKQRLDVLRAALTDNDVLWGPEPACTAAWQALAARYTALLKQGMLPPAHGHDPSPLIHLVSDLLEAKDRHLVNHGNRVSFYATLVGNRLELSLAEQHLLSLGALAHDLDLIAPADGTAFGLDDHDTRHRTDMGARIGRALGLPADAVQIIALHHERWDGTGHPFGLEGSRIPLLARIVSLAQTFDDLTAEKPGGGTRLSMSEAIDCIEKQAATCFDPELTQLFCTTMREQPPQS